MKSGTTVKLDGHRYRIVKYTNDSVILKDSFGEIFDIDTDEFHAWYNDSTYNSKYYSSYDDDYVEEYETKREVRFDPYDELYEIIEYKDWDGNIRREKRPVKKDSLFDSLKEAKKPKEKPAFALIEDAMYAANIYHSDGEDMLYYLDVDMPNATKNDVAIVKAFLELHVPCDCYEMLFQGQFYSQKTIREMLMDGRGKELIEYIALLDEIMYLINTLSNGDGGAENIVTDLVLPEGIRYSSPKELEEAIDFANNLINVTTFRGAAWYDLMEFYDHDWDKLVDDLYTRPEEVEENAGKMFAFNNDWTRFIRGVSENDMEWLRNFILYKVNFTEARELMSAISACRIEPKNIHKIVEIHCENDRDVFIDKVKDRDRNMLRFERVYSRLYDNHFVKTLDLGKSIVKVSTEYTVERVMDFSTDNDDLFG